MRPMNTNTNTKRNDFRRETLKSEFGPPAATCSARPPEHVPIAVPKHSLSFGKMDEQIITMYAKGMSTHDIEAFINNLYGVSISPNYVNTVTDRVLKDVREWQNRSLENMYPVAFFDVLRVKIRSGISVKNTAVHLGIDVQTDGMREVPDMWIAEKEDAASRACVFNGLKARGVENILIAVTDGLKGMTEAVEVSSRSPFIRPASSTLSAHPQRSSGQGGRMQGAQAHLPGRECRGRRTRFGALQGHGYGPKVPHRHRHPRARPGASDTVLPVPSGDPYVDLHDEFDRGAQPNRQEGDQDAHSVSQRGCRPEADLSGRHGFHSLPEACCAQATRLP